MAETVRPSVRGRLREAVEDSLELNGRLEAIIAVPTSKLGGGGTRGKFDRSQPPWNAPVAHLVLELHSGARVLEAELRALLNLSPQWRGGDDANTRFALLAALNLAEAVTEDGLLDEPTRWLNGWRARALVVLGERDLPHRLPRDVGQPEPRCPYCGCLTLRFWATLGEVRCVNPGCLDGAERRPVARMEYSVVVRDWVLAWRDGTVGLPPPDLNDGIAS